MKPAPGKTRRAKIERADRAQARNQVFTLDVMLMEGPMSEQFLKKNKVISRTIRMRSDQTLQDLHKAIFAVFDRWDEHGYEFQVGGKGPMDPKARRYVLPGATQADPYGPERPAGDVTRTALADVGLRKNDTFGYWFDFGDDWWHQINVIHIEKSSAKRTYPCVIARVGTSPPQYLDEEEE